MKKAICIVLIASFSLLVSPSFSVYGAECSKAAKIFSSTYDVTATFDEKGTAKITQKVSLKNLVSGCFASEYSLKINSSKIKDASGSDSLGKLAIRIKKSEDGTLLTAKLNDEVIGKNKSASFVLQYKIEELANKRGFVWDFLVPQIITSEKLTSYKLSVVVPASWGKIFLLKPAADKVGYGKKNTTLTFSGSKNLDQSVSAVFGNEQEISFKLRVPLENKGFFSRKFKVYLPPDTEKQQVVFSKLAPKPESITLDEVGNYVAQYLVKGRSFVEVSIEGTAKITGSGEKFFSPKPLKEQKLAEYRKGGVFVDVENGLIQEKAKELKSPESIYDFVASYLEFDAQGYKKNQSVRKKASSLLRSKPRGTNLDFVNLFTAISKASGVATREVVGFAIGSTQSFKPVYIGDPLRSNKLHVWAQIYDQEKSSWINADTTWRNTSGIDFFVEDLPDRFVLFFSKEGDNIGLLKDYAVSSSNIEIFFAKKKGDFTPKVDMTVATDQSFAGFPVDVVVRVENRSGISLVDAEIKLVAKNLDLIGDDTLNVPIVFPDEKREFKFRVRAGDLLRSTKGYLEVKFTARSGSDLVARVAQKEVQVKSFFSLGTQQILLIFVILLLIVGIAAPRFSRIVKR